MATTISDAVFREGPDHDRFVHVKFFDDVARQIVDALTSPTLVVGGRRRGVNMLASTANLAEPYVVELRFSKATRQLAPAEKNAKLFHWIVNDRKHGWCRLEGARIVMGGDAAIALQRWLGVAETGLVVFGLLDAKRGEIALENATLEEDEDDAESGTDTLDTLLAPSASSSVSELQAAWDALPTSQRDARLAHLAVRREVGAITPALADRLDKLRAVLANTDLEALQRWARGLGVPTPERGVGADVGTADWRKRSAAWLRRVIVREARAGASGAFEPPPPNAWWNYLGEQQVESADGVRRPTRLLDVVEIVRSLSVADRVRAVGAGHAAGGVARAGDPTAGGRRVVVSLESLRDGRLPWLGGGETFVDEAGASWCWEQLGRAGADTLVRVPAGMSVRVVNRLLDSKGLTLKNAGSYDAQGLFGALCTGTHGTGGHLPPIADEVVSIDVVSRDSDGVAALWRIEPTAGPLDGLDPRPAVPRPDLRFRLVRDDEVFRAVLVSFGAMGIAVSVAIRVRDTCTLRERHRMIGWAEALPAMASALARDVRVDVLVNPYAYDHAPDGGPGLACMLQEREEVQSLKGKRRDRPRAVSPILRGMRLAGPSSTQDPRARSSAQALLSFVTFVQGAAADFTSVSWQVLYLGAGAFLTVDSCELHVDLGPKDRPDWDRLNAVVEKVCAIVERFADLPEPARALTISPLGVRLVRGSRAWLAPSAAPTNHVVAAVEFGVPLGSRNSAALVQAVVDGVTDPTAGLRARAHWGQRLPSRWSATDATAELIGLFGDDALRGWACALELLNPDGVFDNGVIDTIAARQWRARLGGVVPRFDDHGRRVAVLT